MAALRRPLTLACAAVLLVLVFGTVFTGPSTVLGLAPPPPSDATLDDEFAAVARLVPQFGGMFLSHNETVLTILLTENSRAIRSAAIQAIRSVFGDELLDRCVVQSIPARYGFLELKAWYEGMVGAVLAVEGVSFTDIDERRNRLKVAAAPEAMSSVMAALDAAGVPGEAVVLSPVPPTRPLAHTLNSSVVPRQGGYALTRLASPSGAPTATLGFNAIRAGVPGFITNSHHSQVWFLLDTIAAYPVTKYYQGQGFVPANYIGDETIDPPGTPCGPPYPPGHNCRHSDSLFGTYTAGAQWAPAILGRTTGLTMWTGAAPCDPANPQCIRTVSHAIGVNVGPGRWGISHLPSLPYLHGLQLHKVGRTTGWTSGTMEGTCMDYVWPANGITVLTPTVLRCQYQVGNQFDADPTNDWWRIATFGDSGSPVFRIRQNAFKHVELYGIAWGGNTFGNSFGAKKFVFSSIRGIQVDLGALEFVGQCLPPFPPC
jgi:hypothetical protein